MAAIVFSSIISALNIGLGFFIWTKNKKHPAHIAFFVFTLGTGMWALFSVLTLYYESLLMARIMFSSGILLMAGIFIFALNFPQKARTLTHKKYIIFLALPAVFYFLSYTNLMAREVTVVNNHLTGSFGPAFRPYALFAIAIVLTTIFILHQRYRASTGIAKLQMKYLFLGSILFMIPGLTTNAILPALFNIRDYNVVGPHFSVFMVGFTAYAIARYRLMDIRIVLQTGLIYSLLFAFVASLYLLSVLSAGYLFQKTTENTLLLGAGLATVIGIFTLHPLEYFFRKITDSYFHKHSYKYSYAIHYLSEVLNKNIDLEFLSQEILIAVKKIFKPEKNFLLIPGCNICLAYQNDSETIEFKIQDGLKHYIENVRPRILVYSDLADQIEKNGSSGEISEGLKQLRNFCIKLDVEVMVFIWNKEEFLGIMALAKKISDEAYTNTDLNLLNTFSMQAAVALEKARLYEQLKEHSQNLESIVHKRTSQIRNLQKEQEEMFLDISHGLQTPLTVAKNELSRLDRNMRGNEKLDLLHKSIDKISDTVYRLLHLARLKNGDNNYPYSLLDLSYLLEELTEYFSVVAEEKDIIIHTELDPGIKLRGNRELLEEMLANLLSNAYKYAFSEKETNRQIRVLLYKKSAAVAIDIIDNGRGINSSDLPNLFERFKRGIKKGKDAHGTGLGLAICQRIAHLHNGSIAVDSGPEKGTRFTILLNNSQQPQ